MAYKTIIIVIGVLIMCSCKHKGSSGESQNITYDYNLVKTGQIKSFKLDDETRYNAFYLWVFTDNGGKEYLSFLNYRTNQILFYDFETTKVCYKMEMEREGTDGVSLLSGCYIKDFKNIYVSSYAIPGLVRTDTTGKIKQKLLYGKTSEGYQIVPSYVPSSHPYVPSVLLGSKLYIVQKPVKQMYSEAHTPVSVTIDTLTNECEQLPFVFGSVLKDEHFMEFGEVRFSREYNDEKFIYSFYGDENIYVTSIDHKQINKINARSKYLDKIEFETSSSEPNQIARWSLEVAHYGDLIYDKYRNIYYRFVYPKTELDPNRDYKQKSLYGRNLFSVMILDDRFNVVGETLFPKDIYNSFVFFVHKEGLYISKDYQINFDQPEDVMTFELFRFTDEKVL